MLNNNQMSACFEHMMRYTSELRGNIDLTRHGHGDQEQYAEAGTRLLYLGFQLGVRCAEKIANTHSITIKPRGFTVQSLDFRTGAAAMREMLANFVEQGGDSVTAESLRANWSPSWGSDPGLAPLPDHYPCVVCGVVKHCDQMLIPSDHRKCDDLVCSQACADDWNDQLAESASDAG